MTSSIDYPSLDPTINSIPPIEPGSRPSQSFSNYSTQFGLAKALHERGAGRSIHSWAISGLSTPNNSPDVQSPIESPGHHFFGPLELLHEGAKMIRRTWTGEETPVPRSVPRISRKELEVIELNLMSVVNLANPFLNI